MLIGILIALLAAAVVVWAIINFDKLLNHIQKKTEETKGTVVGADVQYLINKVLTEGANKKQTLSLETLRKKAGKAGVFTAAIKDGAVIKDSLELISSDQQDEATQELFRENDGLVYVN